MTGDRRTDNASRSHEPERPSTHTIGQRPAGRYGSPSTSSLTTSRILAVLLGLLFVATVIALGFFLYRSTTTSDISGVQTGYEVIDDHTTTMRVDITRDDPSIPVFCIVRAKEYSGAEVGRREFYVGPSPDKTVRIDTRLTTTARAVATDVYGCGADVPAYLLH